jgi:hypothetical protein
VIFADQPEPETLLALIVWEALQALVT